MKEHIKIDRELINQSEIARRLNISPSYLSMILNGHRKSDKVIKRVNKLLQEQISPQAA